MALVNRNFADIVTFTRASAAGRFNAAGLYEQVATNAPRLDFDPATLAPRGLLIEEQRTNLLLWSEQLDQAAIWVNADASNCAVSPNTDVAPDGTTTADTLIDADGSARVGRVQNVSVSNDSVTRTASVFVKKTSGATSFPGFQMQYNTGGTAITGGVTINTNTGTLTDRTGLAPASKNVFSCGNYWRVEIQLANNLSGNTACSVFYYPAVNSDASGTWGTSTTGSSVAWGFDLEPGAFATSYIPTTTAQVTRAADFASINTLSPWFNAAEGTLFVEYMLPFASGSVSYLGRFASFSNGTNNNLIEVLNNGTANASYQVFDGNVQQAQMSLASTTASFSTNRAIGAYRANDFAGSQNGAAAILDTSGTVPSVTQLRIGDRQDGQRTINGWIRKLTYYPQRLTNAQLQSLTS